MTKFVVKSIAKIFKYYIVVLIALISNFAKRANFPGVNLFEKSVDKLRGIKSHFALFNCFTLLKKIFLTCIFFCFSMLCTGLTPSFVQMVSQFLSKDTEN